ncbi:MAG: zinc ribbon domain-containing protein [Nanoarchaeota archaeon]|nr:zinc ribbon domain-containing protein [Nanoarchaeota archaeon]
MAKIPGAIILFVGLAVYVITAYSSFEKSAKILFSVVAALLILYGAGSMGVDYMQKKKIKKEKTKYDYMPQSKFDNYKNNNMNPQAGQQNKAAVMPPNAQAGQTKHIPSGIIGFCSVCGYSARSDDNFCGKCGSRLK